MKQLVVITGIVMGLGCVAGAAVPTWTRDPAVSVALGDEHSCALALSGHVYCWGRNFSGQLGDGTRTDRSRPTLVKGIDQISQLAAFGARTCATRRDGAVYCWGSVGGFLNDGTTPVFGKSAPREWDRDTPQPVIGLAEVTQVALGAEHLCALLRNGTVRCWGRNADGQLGDGTRELRRSPVKVVDLDHVTQLALGVSHSCALLTDGTARCWGANEGGQLGDRTTQSRTKPTEIPDFGAITQLAVSGSSACGLLKNGTVRCWGWNAHGQLGDGTAQNHGIPKAVHGIDTVRELVLGAGFGCARLADRTTWCWGDNGHGQVAADRERERSLVPVQIPMTGSVALGRPGQIEGGHVCALLDYGQVSCWGRNDQGQLGRGTVGEPGAPARVDWPR